VHQGTSTLHATQHKVYREVAQRDALCRRRRLHHLPCPAQLRPHARQQFDRAERLRHVVVGTGIE